MALRIEKLSERGLHPLLSPKAEKPPQVEIFNVNGKEWEYVPPSLRTQHITSKKDFGMCDYTDHGEIMPQTSPATELHPDRLYGGKAITEFG